MCKNMEGKKKKKKFLRAWSVWLGPQQRLLPERLHKAQN